MNEKDQRIASVVLEHWIETGRALTVAEIASKADLSPAVVRRAFKNSVVLNSATRYTEVERPVYSKDYPTMVLRHSLVAGYEPSDAAVRAEIWRAREAAKPTTN